MKHKKIYFSGRRVNYTVTTGTDRLMDYLVKPIFMGSIVFLGNFIGRRIQKRPVTYRTQLISECAQQVSKNHNDSGLTAWFLHQYFWVTSRIMEFDNAYYVRYHETLILFVERLEQEGLLKRRNDGRQHKKA